MHAEYCTVRPLGDCIIWMRKLCTELGFSEFCDEPVPTHGDNDMATGLIRENRHTPANRMILREFHLVQQYCRDGYIDPLRVNTKRNPSDLLTKAVTEVDWNRTIDELRGLRIDLTHALISSLPALNRGLYQAVTSARGILTRCKKAVLGITLRLAGSQTCTITHRRTAEAH